MKTTNQFIESQQELAYNKMNIQTYRGNEEYFISQQGLDTLITQIIENTGEELLRLAEGERKAPYDDDEGDWKIHYQGYDEAIDHLKEHIANLTNAK